MSTLVDRIVSKYPSSGGEITSPSSKMSRADRAETPWNLTNYEKNRKRIYHRNDILFKTMYRQGEPIGVSFGNSQDWKTLWYAGKVEERNRFYYLTDDEQFSRGETRVVAPWADVWASGGRPIWIDIDHMRLPGSKKGEFTIYERKTSLPWPLRTKPKEFTVDMQCALDLIFGSSNLDEVIRHNPKGPIVFLANNSAGPGGIAEYLQHKLHQRGDDRRVLGAEGKVVFYYDGPANKSALGVRPIVEGQDATPRFY